MRDCDFCGIVRGEQPAQVVYETETVLAFLPLNAVAPGHTLVIPRLHTPDFLSCPAPLAGTLSAAAAHVGRAVRAAVAADGMNLITSAGEAASQTVFHLHVHLDPGGTVTPWAGCGHCRRLPRRGRTRRWPGGSGAAWRRLHHRDNGQRHADAHPRRVQRPQRRGHQDIPPGRAGLCLVRPGIHAVQLDW